MAVLRKFSRLSALDAIGLVVVVVMLLLIAYPLVVAPIRTLFVGGSFNAEVFRRVLTSSVFWDAARSTAIILIIAVPLAILVSGTFAWLNERTNARMGVVSTILPIIPLLIPGLSMSIGWKFLADAQAGFLNVLVFRPIMHAFGSDITTGPVNINSWYGLVLVYTLELIPFAYLIISVALRDIDPSYEEASRTSGANALKTFWRVSLPSISPALWGAMLLCFMIGAGMFGVPVVLGTPVGINTLSVYIINATRQSFPPEFDTSTVGSIFLALFVAVLWYLERQVRRRERYSRIGGNARARTLVDLGVWRPVARGVMTLFMIVASLLPLIGLLYVALQPFWSSTLSTSLTLDNFGLVLEDQLFAPLRTSLGLALGGATIGVAVAALASVYMERHRRAASVVDGVLKAPGAITHVAVGIGFLIGLGAAPFYLAGSWQILLLAYLVIYSPQAIIAVGGAYERVGGELAEASAVSGASPLGTFARVSIPLMRPGLTAAWTLLFVHMLSEVTTSSVLASSNYSVVGFVFLNIFQGGSYGELAALAVVVAAINVVITGAVLLRGEGSAGDARAGRRSRLGRRSIPATWVDA